MQQSKKLWKTMLSLVLTLALVITVLPVGAVSVHAAEGEILASGYCGAEGGGKNVTWKVVDMGTTLENSSAMAMKLVIEGRGEMADTVYNLSESETPWRSYKNRIQLIEVKEGVTKIGRGNFSFSSALTEVSIADSVTTVGKAAFLECTKLKSFNIGKMLPEEGCEWSEILDKCLALRFIDADLENRDYTSVDGVLFDKKKETLIKYPSGRTESTYNIPSTTVTIGERAFWGTQLESIVIPGNVRVIKDGAFWGATKCTSVTIEDGVEDIGYSAFNVNDTKEVDVVIPATVKSLGEQAFRYFRNITVAGETTPVKKECFTYVSGRVYAPAATECAELTDDLNYSIRFICTEPKPAKTSFEYTGNEITVIPAVRVGGYSVSDNTQKEIGDYTVKVVLNKTKDLDAYQVNPKTGQKSRCTISYVWGDVTKPETWGEELDTADKEYKWSIVAAADGTVKNPWKIGRSEEDSAFAYLSGSGDNLTLHLGGSGYTSSMGNRPWDEKRSSIKAVVFDEGSAITSFGYGLVTNTAIESIVFPDSIMDISGGCLSGCGKLKHVTFPRDFKIHGGVLAGVSSTIESLTITGSGELEIGYYLSNMPNLTTIKLSGIKTIMNGAFSGCNSLEKVVIPYETQAVTNSAFQKCTKLSEVIFLSGKAKISGAPLWGCAENMKIYVPVTGLSNYKTIEPSAWGFDEEANLIGFAKVDTAAMENGTVSVSKGTLAANDDTFYLPGEKVTINVTPAKGYELKRLIAKDSNGKEVEVKDNTFVVPEANVTVSAEFKATQSLNPT
ncbi:MAG: leucine-rich repeat domain-containing protein, partial [Lachnospiraceae bacterium]|nr:leucine-rich repeat domain-containing protein [Lachnospiraceae bacterium]